MLKLLKRALVSLRAQLRVRDPIHARHAPSERLKRLADTIVAHAPPRRLAAMAMPSETG
jgi:hypothetical protein